MQCDCDYVITGRDDFPEHYGNCSSHWNGEGRILKNKDGTLNLPNTHLKSLEVDVLYHLGLDTDNYNLPALFGDVKFKVAQQAMERAMLEVSLKERIQNEYIRQKTKVIDIAQRIRIYTPAKAAKYKKRQLNTKKFVCIGGTKYRMREFAEYMAEVLDLPKGKPVNLTKHSQRYAMYKVGPVLSVSHGIGIASMTTLLQEVIKLVYYAKAKDPIIFRIGTSGGLAIPPGSVVISTFGLNGTFEKSYDVPILGRVRKLRSVLDARLSMEVHSLTSDDDDFSTFLGGTMTADDFYRGQGRLDGPFCDYSEADKIEFLGKLTQLGVKNIEMEATAFSAMTREAGLRAGLVCVTFLNRLDGDQVTLSKATMREWQTRPMVVVGRFISAYMNKKNKNHRT